MKKWISVLVAIAILLGGPILSATPASADEDDTMGEQWRHDSPLTAGVLLNPVALTAFFADVPIYIVARKQPFTAGLTEMDLIDGYNPITGEKSGEQYDPHEADITDNY